MIPIRVQDARPGFSPVTVAIIAINALVFAYEVHLGHFVNDLIWTYGLIPHRLKMDFMEDPWAVHRWGTPLFSHMFLHGGWIHIFGNMWFLFVFGRCMEKRIGSIKMAVFYFAGGLAGALAQVYLNIDSTMPMIGASGAVAAILGGFLVIGPLRPVLVMFLLVFIPIFLKIPAVVVLVLWFLEQLFAGAMSLTIHSGQAASVAWWAHIGGFIAGFVFIRLFLRPDMDDQQLPEKEEEWELLSEEDPYWRYGAGRANLWRPQKNDSSKKSISADRPLDKIGSEDSAGPLSNKDIQKEFDSIEDGDTIIVYDKWGRPVARYLYRKKE